MAWTAEELRRKYPRASDADIADAVDRLNRKPATVRRIWEGEDQVAALPQGVGPDGLTKPMRELNRFAEDNALAQPFKTRRKKS